MIMVCDHNTTQTSYGIRTFVVLLRGDDQKGADDHEASRFSRSIAHSSKSGNGSILYYVTKIRAQCPVQISINGSRRCYAETDINGMVATISDSSCSVGNTSFKNAKVT